MKISITITIVVLLLAACSSPAPTMQNTTPAANPSPSKGPDETAALDTIVKITTAQATYFKVNRRYALTYEELVEARFLTAEPSTAQTGYEFKLRPAADAQAYKLSVSPAVSSPGARHFFTDQTAVVHAEQGKEASAESPQL